MKIGVVADTNDNRDGLKQLLDRLLVGGAQWLLHCGGLACAAAIGRSAELVSSVRAHGVGRVIKLDQVSCSI